MVLGFVKGILTPIIESAVPLSKNLFVAIEVGISYRALNYLGLVRHP